MRSWTEIILLIIALAGPELPGRLQELCHDPENRAVMIQCPREPPTPELPPRPLDLDRALGQYCETLGGRFYDGGLTPRCLRGGLYGQSEPN